MATSKNFSVKDYKGITDAIRILTNKKVPLHCVERLAYERSIEVMDLLKTVTLDDNDRVTVKVYGSGPRFQPATFFFQKKPFNSWRRVHDAVEIVVD